MSMNNAMGKAEALSVNCKAFYSREKSSVCVYVNGVGTVKRLGGGGHFGGKCWTGSHSSQNRTY